jgi:hypothetical protein
MKIVIQDDLLPASISFFLSPTKKLFDKSSLYFFLADIIDLIFGFLHLQFFFSE